MSATNIEVNPELLADAMRLLGTRTKKDTVNTALREVVQRLRRLEALEQMTARAARGELDPAIHAYEARKSAQRSGA